MKGMMITAVVRGALKISCYLAYSSGRYRAITMQSEWGYATYLLHERIR